MSPVAPAGLQRFYPSVQIRVIRLTFYWVVRGCILNLSQSLRTDQGNSDGTGFDFQRDRDRSKVALHPETPSARKMLGRSGLAGKRRSVPARD